MCLATALTVSPAVGFPGGSLGRDGGRGGGGGGVGLTDDGVVGRAGEEEPAGENRILAWTHLSQVTDTMPQSHIVLVYHYAAFQCSPQWLSNSFCHSLLRDTR